MASPDEWKDEIRTKLCSVFESNLESFVRILWYLDQEEIVYENSGKSPAWRTLKSLIKSDAAFKLYAERIAEDTKRAERDPNFRETMNRIYAQMMEPSDSSADESDHQSFELIRHEDANMGSVSGSMGLARAWTLIPAQSQRQILALIPRIITNQSVLSSIDEVVSLVNRAGGNVVMVGLALAYLAAEAATNIYRWYKGEISGERCCKNIIDSTCSIGAGLGGGVGGAALGTYIMPGIGTVIGGIAGGIISAQVARILSDRLTQYFFGIPKEVAVENAYNYFGIKMTASNSEVNAAFHRKCLEHHPDKGGSNEDFHFVQVNMQIIRVARDKFA